MRAGAEDTDPPPAWPVRYRAGPHLSSRPPGPDRLPPIVWAVIPGYTLWGQVPGRATLVGVTLAVGAAWDLLRHDALGKPARPGAGARAANS